MNESATDPRSHWREPVLRSPFHARARAACRANEWSRWAGYTTVSCYTDVALEYFAARSRATLLDLTPMVKYRIEGPQAGAYLDRLLTRPVSGLAVGRVAYVVWCDDRGKVFDDGTVFRLAEGRYRLCAQDRHLPWLLDCAAGFDVSIGDETDAVAALALQGPVSASVLALAGVADIHELRPFAVREALLAGHPLVVSRTGFTGDLGYELWMAPGAAEPVWDALMQAGAGHSLCPMGTRALEMLRIEAGFVLPHTDFVPAGDAVRDTRGRSPYELGLDRLVVLDRGHFNGRRALLEEHRRGSRYRVVGLEVEGDRPATDAFVYHERRREAGHVTSAMWSPTCKRSIAIATVQTRFLDLADELWVEVYLSKELKWEKRMLRCRLAQRPFYNPARRWATPAPAC